MMQTPAAKRQDVEDAQQQQQQQLVTAARAISAEATAAKKSRSDPLPSGKKARCRPSKDTMEGWGDIICSSTTKKPVGNAEDPMFKAPFLRKEWLNIVEKAQNSAEWDAALAKGWIKPADMGGKKHDKQCEVCSSLCPCSAPALALLPARKDAVTHLIEAADVDQIKLMWDAARAPFERSAVILRPLGQHAERCVCTRSSCGAKQACTPC